MAHPFRHPRARAPALRLRLRDDGHLLQHDRLIDVAVVKYPPRGEPTRFVRRVDPASPSPPPPAPSTACTTTKWRLPPQFASAGHGLTRLLFNLLLLLAEFRRTGLPLSSDGRGINVQRLCLLREPRDLVTAVRHYLGRDHEAADQAIADARATACLLDMMLASAADPPRTVDGLQAYATETKLGGRLHPEEGRLMLTFGKYAGPPLNTVAPGDTAYLDWLLGQDFLPDVKELVTQALIEARGLRYDSTSRVHESGWSDNP